MTVANEYITTAQNLPDDLVQTYRERGFIGLPGVISKTEAARFHTAALEASQRLESFAKGKSAPVFTQLVNVWREDPVLKELTFHPNLAAIAERLAGVALRLWHDHVLIKQPHNAAPTEFHQDQPYWPHLNGNLQHSLSAWVALCDVPVEKGCMTFIEKSQQYTGLRPQDLTDAGDLLGLCPDLAFSPRTTLPLRAGDCTFHNCWTAHMATPNFTDTARVAQIIIYMDADTTYSGARHPVTDPLNLKYGVTLQGEFFPRIITQARD
jgi:ectoine hydroxylase-related dioxygenase (phytanoyl-CoA dioxygenase family)